MEEVKDIGEIEGCFQYMYKKSKYRGLFVKSAIDGDCVVVPLQETKMYEERLNDPDFESNLLLQNAIKKLPLLVINFRDLKKANKEILATRESIYCVGVSLFLRKEIIFRIGMQNIFGMRYDMLTV
jgi:hypothetical protein